MVQDTDMVTVKD